MRGEETTRSWCSVTDVTAEPLQVWECKVRWEDSTMQRPTIAFATMMLENLTKLNPPKKGSMLKGRTCKICHCLSRFRHFHRLKNKVGFESMKSTHIWEKKYVVCCFLSPVFWTSKLQARRLISHAETSQKICELPSDSSLIPKNQMNFRPFERWNTWSAYL